MKMIPRGYSFMCVTLILLLDLQRADTTTGTQATLQNALALCPGEALIVQCSVMGGGATVWQGTALEQCMDNSIILRHSQFGVQGNVHGTCASEAIVGRVIGVVNNSYVSELRVTVNPEMHNKTVQCVHSYNLTETAVKVINITVISESEVSQNLHHVDAQLSNVSVGELMFSWNPKIKRCNSSSLSFYYFIESSGCGSCPHETHMNYVTCNNVSSINNLCSFTVGANTSDGIWEDHVNVSIRVPEAPETKIISTYVQDDTNVNQIVAIECMVKKTESFNFNEEIDGSATRYNITYTAIGSQLTCKTVSIPSTAFDGEYFRHEFEVDSTSCHSSNIEVSVYATNVLGDGSSSSTVIEAKNSYVHVDVDPATDFIFCILENSEHENSTCIIKTIYELQGETCNSDRLEESTYAYQNLTSSNVSIAHLPHSQLFCFVAEANNSTSTVILVGKFSAPIGVIDDVASSVHQITTAFAVLIIIVVAIIAVSVVIVYIVVYKRMRRIRSKDLMYKSIILTMRNQHTSASQSGSVLNRIWGKNKREVNQVIYADVNVVMAKSSTFPTILDDDQVEYAKLDHNVHKNLMASSPKQEEATSQNHNHTTTCNLDNLLIQLRPEVTPHWYQLGTIIGMDKDTLEKYSQHPPEQCIIEVLDYWLRNHYDSRPTWRDVACVLEIIQLNKLAQNLLKVYETGKLPIEVVNTNTMNVPCLSAVDEDNQKIPPPLPPKA